MHYEYCTSASPNWRSENYGARQAFVRSPCLSSRTNALTACMLLSIHSCELRQLVCTYSTSMYRFWMGNRRTGRLVLLPGQARKICPYVRAYGSHYIHLLFRTYCMYMPQKQVGLCIMDSVFEDRDTRIDSGTRCISSGLTPLLIHKNGHSSVPVHRPSTLHQEPLHGRGTGR